MGFADDMADLLATGGITTSIFRGDLPERPNVAICIAQTAAPAGMHTFGSAVGVPPLEYQRCQIRCRAEGYVAVETIMLAVHSALDGLRTKAVNGKTYHWIAGDSSPYYLGADEQERPEFACNYTAARSNGT